jgi:hypothetical protein
MYCSSVLGCKKIIRANRAKSEMEFVDINLTKDSSLLLHATGGFYEKISETRKLKSIHEQHFVERKNKGRKL